MTLTVRAIDPREATRVVIAHHYLHRRSSTVFAYGLFAGKTLSGVVIFGIPASREMQTGACPDNPNAVVELNRLWVSDDLPRNSETYFLARALALMPPRIVLSYADTTRGHVGFVYRAANFHYAGWSDMERKTARLDYLTPGKHTRDAFRSGDGAASVKVRRRPKVKYWIVTGNRRARKALEAACKWPRYSWKQLPPPMEHTQYVAPKAKP